MLTKLKRIPHALLLIGECPDLDPFLKQWIAKDPHPDLHHYRPEGKSGLHTIESLKQLQEEAALVPFEAPYKIFLIHEAHRMLPTSANALLKTLEEPPAKSLLILMTEDERQLIDTIRSRCQTLRYPKKEWREDPLASLLFDAASGRETAIKDLEKKLEQERKAYEKELLATLPREMTLKQKESYLKEIEGAAAVRYQTRVMHLFEHLLIWQRDRLAKELGASHLLSQRELPFRPLTGLNESIEKAMLAIKRGMKFSSALNYILMSS